MPHTSPILSKVIVGIENTYNQPVSPCPLTMSNSYTSGRQWNQSFGPLQLEQEYDFGGSSNDPYPDSYAQQHLPNSNPHSSSLLGAFAPQPSQSRPPAFSAAQGGHPNQTGGYVHGIYGSQSSNPAPSSTSAPYRTNPTTFNFSASTSTLQGMDSTNTTQNPIPNFLNSSPAPTQQSFSQPPTPNPYYHPPSNNRTSNPPLPKRHHTLAFKPEEDPDGEIGTDQKDGTKSKLYVLISLALSHALITLQVSRVCSMQKSQGSM